MNKTKGKHELKSNSVSTKKVQKDKPKSKPYKERKIPKEKKTAAPKKKDIQYVEKKTKVNKTKEVRPKVKKRKKKIFRKIFLLLFLALLVFFAIRMTENGWTKGGFLATVLGHNSKTVDTLEPIYIVVTGESQGLTDSIMLCEYNPKDNTANIISIPRDTFIGENQNRASAYDKINTLYAKSPEKLLEKINEITGLNVKYYMNIDTKGLRELIDEMGGVYFDVPIDMDYDDETQDLHIHLKAGYQLLDGDKAEQVVRFRHNNDGSSYPSSYGDNDIGRMRTQREFVKTLAKQALSKNLLLKMNDYVKILKNNVKTNFNLNDVINYVPYVVDFKMENLNSVALPGKPKLCNGVWLYIPDYDEISNIVK